MGVTRAGRVIAWVEEHCRIPEGRDVGKPVKLREWQRDIIRKIYDNPAGTRRAILSFGRKNAKTALSAMLNLVHLCGPEARANSQLYSAAQSRDQAAILFSLAAKMVRMSPDLNACILIRDSAKELVCPELGTKYKALSAEATTAYGLSPVFVVHDELGQVRGPRSELYEALETATAAQDAPLSIVISTQAPKDGDLLSVLIDDALQGNDPRTVVKVYSAPMDLDPFSEEAVRAANPAFGDFQNAAEVMAMAEDARRMPSREAEFRNLVLNQRIEMNNPFIARTIWEEAAGPVADDWTGFDVYAGLDLSAVRDLTAFVMVGHDLDADRWHVRPLFWLPRDGLIEKARSDRVPYDVWEREGWLQTVGGRSIGYEWVADEVLRHIEDYDVKAVAFDRWGWNHFQPWLMKAGADEGVCARFVPWGQGFKDMTPALRETESLLLNGKVRHGGHPVLTMCAGNAVVQQDAARNRKLAKLNEAAKIDGMVAMVMAFGVASRMVEQGTVSTVIPADYRIF